MILAIKTITNM